MKTNCLVTHNKYSQVLYRRLLTTLDRKEYQHNTQYNTLNGFNSEKCFALLRSYWKPYDSVVVKALWNFTNQVSLTQ